MRPALFWEFLLAAGFFILSSLFSAAETALVSLSRPRLKKLISQKPELANAFTHWLDAPHYLLTTILIGNTLSNVLATLLVTHLAQALLPRTNPALLATSVWLLMTLVLFVFADFVPKSLARYYPQRVALASIRTVSKLSHIATPCIRGALGVFEKFFPALAGVPVGRLPLYSLEELREMIRAGAVQGEVPHRSSQMMERALTLQKIPVSKIMTPFKKIDAVNLGWDPDPLIDQVAEAGHTRTPAYRADARKIGGYLHVKDLLLVWRGSMPLQIDALLRQPLWIDPAYTAGRLLEDFRKGTSHLAIVNDANGECQGLVTLEDVLEEIVGEILDEYDTEGSKGLVGE